MQSKGFNELGMRERHLLSSITVADPTDIVAAAAEAFNMVHVTLPAAEGMAL